MVIMKVILIICTTIISVTANVNKESQKVENIFKNVMKSYEEVPLIAKFIKYNIDDLKTHEVIGNDVSIEESQKKENDSSVPEIKEHFAMGSNLNISMEDFLNMTAMSFQAFNASKLQGKIDTCIFQTVKAFVVCELGKANDWRDLMTMSSTLQCLIESANALVKCFVGLHEVSRSSQTLFSDDYYFNVEPSDNINNENLEKHYVDDDDSEGDLTI